jgi:hypothetical protein
MPNGKVVTCGQCIARRAELADWGKHAVRASELFRVAGIAGISDSGCQMYYSIDGQIALCAAARQQLSTYLKKG